MGFKVITGGTDSHQVVVKLDKTDSNRVAKIARSLNMNISPVYTIGDNSTKSGVSFGLGQVTLQNFTEQDLKESAGYFKDIVELVQEHSDTKSAIHEGYDLKYKIAEIARNKVSPQYSSSH